MRRKIDIKKLFPVLREREKWGSAVVWTVKEAVETRIWAWTITIVVDTQYGRENEGRMNSNLLGITRERERDEWHFGN